MQKHRFVPCQSIKERFALNYRLMWNNHQESGSAQPQVLVHWLQPPNQRSGVSCSPCNRPYTDFAASREGNSVWKQCMRGRLTWKTRWSKRVDMTLTQIHNACQQKWCRHAFVAITLSGRYSSYTDGITDIQIRGHKYTDIQTRSNYPL